MEYLVSEIGLVLILLLCMTKFKSYIPTTEKVLNGLIVYFPPDQEKITKALANPKKFVINCGHIDEKYSRNSPCFLDTEFLLLLGGFGSISVAFAIVLNYFIGFTLNTSTYIVLLTIGMSIHGAYSQIRLSGFRNPDNWMGLFYSMTLFCFSSMLMYLDHQSLLDFNFHFSLTLLGLQSTESFHKFSGFSLSINHLVFCLIYSLSLSLLVFPYFRYLFRSTLNYYSSKENPFEIQGVKSLSYMYKYTIIFPFFISILWTAPVSSFFTTMVSQSTWEHLRIFIVVSHCALRIYQLRNEVQILLDQGKSIIYDIIRNPSDENKKESDLQCKAIGAYAWPLAYQSLCYSFLILSLCLLLLCKGEVFRDYPAPVKQVVYKDLVVGEYDENEFVYDTTAVVTPSMSIYYYKEIKEMEKKIREIKKEKFEDPARLVEVLINSKYVPSFFYRDTIEYAIWLYHFSSVFAVLLTLLYRQRFYKKLKQS